jgi:hypothetical protein
MIEGDLRTLKKSTIVKFVIDIIMAITFVLFFNKRVLGGLAFHEIAGLVIGVVFFTHVLLNWRWVKNVTLRLFDSKISVKTKVGYVLNLLLLISMAFIILSGIFISKVVFPNLDVSNERGFKISHIPISYLALLIVAAHIGLHWNWIMGVFKNIFKIKKRNSQLGTLAKVATVFLLLFGVYQMISTDFFTRLGRVANVFAFSSSQMPEGNFNKDDFKEGNFKERNFQERDFRERDFSREEGNFENRERPERGFHGEEGDFKGGKRHGSANALSVIVTYFSIMSVFIILIYYIEKFVRKNKVV